MCGNAGLRQVMGGYTPGPSGAERQAMMDAPRLAREAAETQAAQGSNMKLAARNRRGGTSLLATGGIDGGIAPAAPGKAQLGA